MYRPEIVISPRKGQAPALLLALAAALVLVIPAGADPSVTSKQAQARQVLGEIQQLDSRLEKAVEAYDLATARLAGIQHELKVNAHDLVVARANLRVAQSALAQRLVALYTSGSENSTLEVLLGSTSLDDLLNRIDSVNRVSDQDTRVLKEVVTFRGAVGRHEVELKRARAQQTRLVAERAGKRRWIEGQLAERQRLLASIRSEIARLQAAEQARQLQLVRQARARLATQRASTGQREAGAGVGIAASAPEGVTVAPPARYGSVVGIAMQYLGVPYAWGGASPAGFDCSGFIMFVFAQVGVSLPHNAAAQFTMGVPISRDQLEPGDLVFFDGLGHAGIYIGGDQFIHAPHAGDVVKISSLDEAWYAATYVGARRIL